MLCVAKEGKETGWDPVGGLGTETTLGWHLSPVPGHPGFGVLPQFPLREELGVDWPRIPVLPAGTGIWVREKNNGEKKPRLVGEIA